MGINDCELLSTSINFGVEDFTDAIHLPISIDGEFSGFKEPCTPTAGSPPDTAKKELENETQSFAKMIADDTKEIVEQQKQ